MLNVQANEVMSTAYEHLSRLSMFVEAAREDELVDTDDGHHQHFSRLLHDVEVDLHALLCRLCIVYMHLPQHAPHAELPLLTRQAVHDIKLLPRLINIHEPGTRAHRHMRDYATSVVVLRAARRLDHDTQRLILDL